MDTETIIDLLVKDAFPVYSSSNSTNADKQIFKEILKSLSDEQLMDVNEQLEYESDAPWELKDYIEWLLRKEPRQAPIIHRNEPITTLIRWFANKKSGKATYAFYHLKKRYPQQSFAVQKQILRVFLTRTASSADWAADRLLECWIPSLAQNLQDSWEKRDTSLCYFGLSMAVLEKLPREYAVAHQEELAKDVGYGNVCRVLGNEPGFIIDEGRLDVPFWFEAMACLGKNVDIPTMRNKLTDYLYGLDTDDSMLAFTRIAQFRFNGELSSFILPSLRKLKATELLVQLERFLSVVSGEIALADENDRMNAYYQVLQEMFPRDNN